MAAEQYNQQQQMAAEQYNQQQQMAAEQYNQQQQMAAAQYNQQPGQMAPAQYQQQAGQMAAAYQQQAGQMAAAYQQQAGQMAAAQYQQQPGQMAAAYQQHPEQMAAAQQEEMAVEPPHGQKQWHQEDAFKGQLSPEDQELETTFFAVQEKHRKQLELLARAQQKEIDELLEKGPVKRQRVTPEPFPVGRVQSGLFLTKPTQAGPVVRGSGIDEGGANPSQSQLGQLYF